MNQTSFGLILLGVVLYKLGGQYRTWEELAYHRELIETFEWMGLVSEEVAVVAGAARRDRKWSCRHGCTPLRVPSLGTPRTRPVAPRSQNCAGMAPRKSCKSPYRKIT